MILYVLTDSGAFSAFLEGSRKDFELLGENAYLIQQKGSWSLRLPWVLIRYRNKNNPEHVLIRHRRSDQRADLFLIPGNELYRSYVKFRMPQGQFSVGSADTCDVVLKSRYMAAEAFLIDPEQNLIQALSPMMPVLNQKKTKEQCIYHNGDVLEYFGLRIIFHQKFLMINQVDGLSVNLPLYQSSEESTQRFTPIHMLQYVELPFEMPDTSLLIRLEEAPLKSENHSRSLLFSIGPTLMMSSASLSSGLLSVYLAWQNGRELIEMAPMILLPSVMMFSALLWNPLQSASERRNTEKENRQRLKGYDRYLNSVMDQVDAFREAYIGKCQKVFPDMDEYVRRYESGSVVPILDTKDLYLRAGCAYEVLDVTIENREKINDSDPDIAEMKALFMKEALRKVRVPYLIDLHQYHKIVFDSSLIHMIADLMMQIALRYHPDEVGIAIICDLKMAEENRWMLDLPHLFNEQDVRLLADEPHEIKEVIELCRSDPRKIILFNMINEDLDLSAVQAEICFASADAEIRSDLRIADMNQKWIAFDFQNHRQIEITPDHFNPDVIRFASRLKPRNRNIQIAGAFSFLEMHGCMDTKELNIAERWNTSDINSSVQGVIGCSGEGRDVILDLYEKRDGPHGLIAGTTGSGKSELILTMILSLALNYAPKDLQFILIDFKGGSSLNSLTNENNPLPHVTGTLSNLDEEDIQRVLVQFSIECKKRENLLKEMSMQSGLPVMNISDYRRLWKKESGLAYMPELVIIVDEFAELKKEQPEFLNELISIARIGRSLGIHLILSTQKPAGVVTDQIWSNARFKICLKVSEKQDSMEMIRSPEAASIREAGCFYLLADERLVYGRSGYVQSRTKLSDSLAVIYDTSHRIVKSSNSLLERDDPEINRVISAINLAYAGSEKVGPLWNQPLISVSWDDLSQPWSFGLLDDYRHNQTLPLILGGNQVHAFVSVDLSEKKNLCRTILRCILENCAPEDDLAIIDDLKVFDRNALMQCNQISDVFYSADEERCRSLYDIIFQRTDAKNHLYVMIDDLSAHYEADDEYRSRLMKCLASCESCRMTVILLSSAASVYSYREIGLLSSRYVLKGASMQDIQSFLETGTKLSVSKPHHGILMHDPLLDFCITECDEDMLADTLNKAAERAAERKRMILPHMPDTIDSQLCEEEGIPVGIRKKDYRWVTLRSGMNLKVIANDPEEAEPFIEYLKTKAAGIVKNTQTIPQIAFTAPDQLGSFDSANNRNTMYIFLNGTFRMQYRVNSRIQYAENEAVMYFRNKTEVIRIAEK